MPNDPVGPSQDPVVALQASTAGAGGAGADHLAADERMTELEALLRSLSSRDSAVYTHVGQSGQAGVAGSVYAVAIKAAQDWPAEGGPISAAAVAGALRPIAADEAVELLADLSTRDLAYSVVTGDPEQARREAARVAEILGPDTNWLTNIERISGGSWSFDPVTGHTFDGVVAAEASGLCVVLLQVAED